MINRNNFLLKEIPKYHPLGNKYINFWKDQKRKCIEGYWHSGYWMPGNLYFYANFGTILLNKSASSKVKVPGKPFLRDIEWEFFYNWIEARGFSGFSEDTEFTCVRKSHPEVVTTLKPHEYKKFVKESPNVFKPDGTIKTYIPARDYLRKQHIKNLGYPLFENESMDFMMMGSRGFGKSYMVGVGVIAHEWLFDGQTHYIPKELRDENYSTPSASIMCGAGAAKYSSDLLDKTRFAIRRLPGEQELNGVLYPSPFFKQSSGSWMPGKKVIAEYKKKIGGNWKTSGTGSVIHHRTFKDNPFAANGLRCSIMVFEEIGMHDNLIASRNASVECQMNGSYKFGSKMFLGTGGDMDGGTIDASLMFRDPQSFNLLAFEDIWEHRGKIGYFVPAYLGLNQYKDNNGFSQVEEAKEFLEDFRSKLRKGKSGSAALDDELQNRPLVPSEVFLTKKGNIFPIAELQDRLNELRDTHHILEKCVTLHFDKNEKTGVGYKLDLDKKLTPLNHFPLTDHQKRNREGCTVIYEFPCIDDNGEVPGDMYIMGHDPYASDDPNGDSLGAVYVLKNKKYLKHGHDEIVASFVGRPYQGRRVINEAIYKLSLFYGGAKIYFENVRGNTKEYFEKIRRLDLLAKQPTTVLNNRKAGWESTGRAIIYGYPMSNQKMKAEGIQYIRDWLLEERGMDEEGRILRNLNFIPDMGIIQELISFNMDGNFDRVMAFMGCVIGLEETYNQYSLIDNTPKKLSIDFLTNNNKLFKSTRKSVVDFADFIIP